MGRAVPDQTQDLRGRGGDGAARRIPASDGHDCPTEAVEDLKVSD